MKIHVAACMLLLITACSSDARKVESLAASGDAAGLERLYTEFRHAGKRAEAQKAFDALASMPGGSSEIVLVRLMKAGDETERERALCALEKRGSRYAVEELVSRLLNGLQTGADVKGEVARLNRLDPQAIIKAREEMIEKSRQSRAQGSLMAATQFLENAESLSRLAGGGDISAERAGLITVRQQKRQDELVTELISSMEAGQLTRSYDVARTLNPLAGGKLAGQIADLQRLSALEEHFYKTAQRQEAAKKAFEDAAKSGVKGEELAGLKEAWNSVKGDMILARRGLEKERRRLPALTEAVKNEFGR
jgi:hypothetical protein